MPHPVCQMPGSDSDVEGPEGRIYVRALELVRFPLQLAKQAAGARQPEGMGLPWDVNYLVWRSHAPIMPASHRVVVQPPSWLPVRHHSISGTWD